MPAPYTKQALLALVDTYIPAPTDPQNFPNIRALEHQDLENKILDRVDGRVLKTGTFSILNFNAYTSRTITFSPPVYTNKYIVMVTPVSGTPNTMATHRATFTITGRTTSQFTILLQPNSGTYNARFWYAVFSKEPL
jgi:hypothetical protein